MHDGMLKKLSNVINWRSCRYPLLLEICGSITRYSCVRRCPHHPSVRNKGIFLTNIFRYQVQSCIVAGLTGCPLLSFSSVWVVNAIIVDDEDNSGDPN